MADETKTLAPGEQDDPSAESVKREPTQESLTFKPAEEETPEGEEEATEEVAVEGEEEEVDVAPEVPEKGRFQKRIDELTALREREREKRIRAEAELELAKERLAEKPPEREPEKPAPTARPKPRQEDFDDYDEYTEALAGWKADQIVEERLTKWREEEAQRAEQDRMSATQQSFVQKMAAGRELYDDFDEVVKNPVLPINYAMVDIIQDMERPAEVAYYLGQNITECVNISRMSPTQAAVALGKIEAKIVTSNPTPPKPPQRSGAPEPIQPVGGGGASVVTKHPEKMDNEEYRAWRKGER